MKGHNFLPLVVSLAFLTGCQQLNDGVNSVNGAINSSLSSLNSTVDKALGVSASGQDSGQQRPLLVLVLSAKTMKKMQWQQKRNGQAEGSLSPMLLFLKLRRAEVPAI